MADFTLLITTPPFTGNHHALAMRFVRATADKHNIKRIFFYQDAVLAANKCQQAPQGQTAACSEWAALSEQYGIALSACIANSLRRGIANDTEATRYELREANLHPAFELVGLGEMTDAINDSDQVVQF
ncbi:MAG: sulfurtransferase complex subunit TusD [Thalassolituus sp.]